jgi:hypothetical protein
MRHPTGGGLQVGRAVHNTQIGKTHGLHGTRRSAYIFCSGWGNQYNRQMHLCSLFNQLAGKNVMHFNILRSANLQICNTNHRNSVS